MKKYVKCQITSICRKSSQKREISVTMLNGRDINSRGQREHGKMEAKCSFYPTQVLYKQVNKNTSVLSVLILIHVRTDANYWITTRWLPLCDPLFHLLFTQRIKTWNVGTFGEPLWEHTPSNRIRAKVLFREKGKGMRERPSWSGDMRETGRQTDEAGKRGTREERERTWGTVTFKGCRSLIADVKGTWQRLMI